MVYILVVRAAGPNVQLSNFPVFPEMATQPEVIARHSYARCLLERGIRTSSAVTMLQAKFNVGRSSAYEDLRIVQAELDASDDGPAQSEPTVCPDTLQAQLVHALDKAFATDSYKEIPKLIRLWTRSSAGMVMRSRLKAWPTTWAAEVVLQ